MPEFRYITRNEGGNTVSGIATAVNARALSSELRGRGLMVIDILPQGETRRPSGSGRAGLRTAEAENGLRQIASMLHGGLTLLQALKEAADQAGSARAGAVWRGTATRIEQGSTLADAMAASPRAFPFHVVQLIRVGEASGQLELTMNRAADHLERARHLRMTVANALAYPAVVTVLAIAVAAFLVLSVIPKLRKYLGERGRELPALTNLLLDFSSAVQSALPHLAIGLLAGAIALYWFRRWPPGLLAMDRLCLRLPLLGKVWQLAGTSMVARGLGILLESGVTLLDALGATARLPGNAWQRAALVRARENVLRGAPLAPQLSFHPAFIPMLPRMAAVGEQSGTLTRVLEEVARHAEHQLLVSIRRLSMLIEPVVVIVVGGIVGFVYIAFFLALFSLAGNIN